MADEVDYRIEGNSAQYIVIELDPGESAVAEAGAMMFKDSTIGMETVFGDGSSGGGGLLGRLAGAGKRLVSGAGLFITVFTQNGHGKGKVGFAAPFPGTILPIKLSDVGGTLICQKDSFLAAAKGVTLGIAFRKRILTGLFGGEGFILQKLEGDGWVFVHMGGSLIKHELAAGEVMHVDTGCLAAMTADVDYDVETVGGVKSMMFGGEGMFFVRVKGPGTVWLQSLPFSRLAGRMWQAAPQHGNEARGEGAVIGAALGSLLDKR